MQIVSQIYKSFTQVKKVTLCMFIHHSPLDSTGSMRMFNFFDFMAIRTSNFCAYVISEYYFVAVFLLLRLSQFHAHTRLYFFGCVHFVACCFTEINIFIHSIMGLSSCNFGFRAFYCRLSKRQTHVHEDSDVVCLIANMKNKNG